MNNALITDEQRVVLLANGRESLGEPGLRSGARGQAVHAGRRRDLAADRD
jgi:hypothetical protein